MVVLDQDRYQACRVSSLAAFCPSKCACIRGRRPPRGPWGRDRVLDGHDPYGRVLDGHGRGQDAV